MGKGRQAHTGQTRRLPLISRPLPLRTDHSLSEHSSRITANALTPHFQRVAPVIPNGLAGVFLCYETGLPDCILLSSPVGLLGMTVSAMNAHYSVNSFAGLTPRPNKLFLNLLPSYFSQSATGCPRRTVVTTTRTHGHPKTSYLVGAQPQTHSLTDNYLVQLLLRRWKVVIRRAHNPEIASANLAAATCYNCSSSVTGDEQRNRFDNCRAVFAFCVLQFPQQRKICRG